MVLGAGDSYFGLLLESIKELYAYGNACTVHSTRFVFSIRH